MSRNKLNKIFTKFLEKIIKMFEDIKGKELKLVEIGSVN